MVSKSILVDDLVRVKSDFCGWISSEGDASLEDITSQYEKDMEFLLASYTHARRTSKEALEYARQCYENSSNARACGSYAVPFIPSVSSTVAYPFSPKICALPTSFQVDNGVVDSNIHLGINLQPKSRVGFRKIFTYSPILAEENYSSD